VQGDALGGGFESLLSFDIIIAEKGTKFGFPEQLFGLFPGMGALGGIHSALHHSATDRVFVVGCDMPHIKGELIRYLCALADEADVVLPEGESGLEPLYSVYRKSALPALEESLRSGRRGMCSFHEGLRVHRVERGTVEEIDPGLTAFRNINTPEDYYRFRRDGESSLG
jgi:molybdopterin-guanine dinucleotide biosynthesis protein A